MGKKSRVKTQKSGTGATASVSPKETLNLTSELLQKCSSPAPGPGKEWEEYVQIRSLVEKIRKKQKGLSVTFDGKREDYFPDLMKWASENGASVEGFEMVNFKEEGFGLRATRDIKAEELFLWVPRKLLMTVESAKNSVLGPLYSQDRILQAMGNITLAFHLLCERADPNSFWQPYIQTLPSEYDTPLYFEEDEVRDLQSTQAIHDVFSQYKNTARQYAYFYKVIQTHPHANKLPLKDAFTYEDYRWAVSSVMTRQNQIPTEDGSRVTLALIPLWDMCNHTNGLITTGYNLEDDRCECVALRDFRAGEQIYIFYGTRSNAEFVIHSGFFFDNNSHDRVKIKLGVSKSDRLYAMKAEVLARAGIPTSSVFALHYTDPPVSAQLLAFLRVFCMTEEELKEHLLGDNALDRIFTLGNSEYPVSWDNEVRLWTFLEDRASLLLKTYKTTIEEDKSFLRNHDLSVRATMAIKLRLGEKEILEKAVKSAAANREHYRKQMQAGAPLPRCEESGTAGARLPLALRDLEAEASVQEALSLTEAVGRAKAVENGLVNGENSIPNGTRSGKENFNQEGSERATEGTKESSSDSTAGAREQ
ncbi:actin-histidine N-methyltransferase [Vulpes vulpes]|nr:actin-histidine N-methyltransferase isoform X2 [Canis lupus dingo]XP_025868340.1 histone-lysine N-methyltransferase setd3 [Vulpes vulpes]XP_025868341.1 histone-lysine N-methyltransferase setd3 [Vulpes vulpes]XP_038401623.1 actin-histidine N-methyltransferase isoform X2 [Canis lupus familiaris]XP_038451214.1 actin-histidine N-methyltransferase isoform X2 [Canis lupus familiaris]XP_038530538.1 actin-histidine N-methyltransferase isoform X2 [Canis lupus familiaris]XP_041614446.1 actin-histidi|eukprot:XP_547974.2 histone-lysine N-methyltransferase setd3 isoform X2 [Canis lupus familiaris]